MVEIKHLNPLNAETVVSLGREMHRNSTFRTLAYSQSEFRGFLDAIIELPHLQGFVAREGEQTVGFVLCGVQKTFFGPDMVAVEFALYVDPEYRSKGVAKQLVRSYVDWALAKGARRVNAGNSAGTPDEAYVSLMQREGFTRVGSLLYIAI